MNRIVLSLLLATAALGASAREPTEVMFFFDTEDYTSDRANDSVVQIAQTFTDACVTGHFAIVGYLAQKWMDYGRTDVVEALKPHLIGTQTMYHSLHPNILEMADERDFSVAYANVMAQEKQGVDLIKKALGRDDIICGVPPGTAKSYVAMYVWADLGIPFWCDTVIADGEDGDLWYCNQRHYDYNWSMDQLLPTYTKKPDFDRLLNSFARRRRVLLFLHPNMATFTKFWDWEPYRGGNNVPFGQWEKLPERPAEETAEYLRRLGTLARRLKADPRFKIVTLKDKLPSAPRRAISRADMPVLHDWMAKHIRDVREPASWCVADVFQAAVRFLRGEGEVLPGKVYGFLEEPYAVTGSVRVTRAEMVEAARRIDLTSFVPASIKVGGTKVGPGDFLVGALQLLATGADAVTLCERPQYARDLKPLQTFQPKGTWTHATTFKDEIASDRLRWQIWTLRREG